MNLRLRMIQVVEHSGETMKKKTDQFAMYFDVKLIVGIYLKCIPPWEKISFTKSFSFCEISAFLKEFKGDVGELRPH